MNLRNRNFRRWRGLEDVDPTKWSEDGRIFSDSPMNFFVKGVSKKMVFVWYATTWKIGDSRFSSRLGQSHICLQEVMNLIAIGEGIVGVQKTWKYKVTFSNVEKNLYCNQK